MLFFKSSSWLFRLSFVLVLFWVVLILMEPYLAMYPNQIQLDKILQPPQWVFEDVRGILGYDDLGRPILDRLISGAKISFSVAISVAMISLVIGTLIGVLSAYIGGKWDHFIIRVIDVFMAFPGILLAIALSGLMGAGISNVIIALCVVSWVGYARLARAQVLSLKQREHVLGAIALGASHVGIVSKHILPLIISPLLIEFTFGIAGLIIAEAGLSFLDLNNL